MWAIFVISKLIAYSKRSPVRRKFAQSGHPAGDRDAHFKRKKTIFSVFEIIFLV
jgi:hypothetical protein